MKLLLIGAMFTSFIAGYFLHFFQGRINGGAVFPNKYGYLTVPRLDTCGSLDSNIFSPLVESVDEISFNITPAFGGNIKSYYVIKHKGYPSEIMTKVNNFYSSCWPNSSENYSNLEMLTKELDDNNSELRNIESFIILKDSGRISVYFNSNHKG